jgi:hypothetical protein
MVCNQMDLASFNSSIEVFDFGELAALPPQEVKITDTPTKATIMRFIVTTSSQRYKEPYLIKEASESDYKP